MQRRILFITHELSYTGAPLVLMDMIRYFKKQEYEILVISMQDGELRKDLEEMGIALMIKGHFLADYQVFLKQMELFDLVVVNSLASFEAIQVLKFSQTPVVWWIHEGKALMENNRNMLPDMSKLPGNVHVFSVSDMVAKDIEQIYGYKTDTLSFGIQDCKTDRFVKNEQINLIHIGNFHPTKGQDVFIQALCILTTEERIRLRIKFVCRDDIFDTDIKEKVLQYVAQNDNTEINAWMQHEELCREIQKVDCVIVSSRHETMSTVAMEGMMLATPCVCTNTCGIADYITDNLNGFIIPAEDPTALAEKIRELINNRSLLVKCGIQARKLYEQKFSIPVFKKNIKEKIECLLENPGPQVFCYVNNNNLDGIQITFQDIFFDDRLAAGGIKADPSIIEACGGRNHLLGTGADYELLLRLAIQYPVHGIYAEGHLIPEEKEAEHDWKTDCYVIARYTGWLRKEGLFDETVSNLIASVTENEQKEEKISYLEEMISQGAKYHKLYQATQPVLLIRGRDFCYNILNVFEEQMKLEFQKKHIPVVVCEVGKKGIQEIQNVMNAEYRAIIGFQSPLLGCKVKNQYVYDLLKGPKYEMLLDAPFWFCESLQEQQKNLHILTLDQNYAAFIRKYYPIVKEAYFLPPGGMEGMRQEKQYDCIFLGTYNDYRTKLAAIWNARPEIKHLAYHYMKLLKQYSDEDAEKVFCRLLEIRQMELPQENIPMYMKNMGDALQCIMYYYRERIIETVLKSGIELQVYGDSWKKSTLTKYPNLVLHEEVPADKGIEELQKAKISLNIMAWHKAGMTERIANSMLNHAVVISNKSEIFKEEFKYGEELYWFDLDEIKKLPDLIHGILKDEQKQRIVAEQAYRKAKANYTWEKQLERFLKILENDS